MDNAIDHETAESLLLVDKYLLQEMSADERTQFEKHLFDCPICAEKLRRDFTTVENLKVVLREEKAHSTSADVARSDWRNWFRLSTLVPSGAALLLACVLGYQTLNRVPFQAARILPAPAAVLMSATRGENKNVVPVDRKIGVFQLEIKGDSSRPESFECEFQNAAGFKLVTLHSEPQKTTEFDLRMELPAKTFPAGEYQLILRPDSEPDRIITYPFVVEDSK